MKRAAVAVVVIVAVMGIAAGAFYGGRASVRSTTGANSTSSTITKSATKRRPSPGTRSRSPTRRQGRSR
jgi:hypothetical protein